MLLSILRNMKFLKVPKFKNKNKKHCNEHDESSMMSMGFAWYGSPIFLLQCKILLFFLIF
jgi:hypothetical protein